MIELLETAWDGWYTMNTTGKLSAALLISLVLLWVYSERVPQKTFLIYTTAVTAVCIFPLTAAGLMLYQTRFFDYEWIWSVVPVTAMIALALTLFAVEILPDSTKGNRRTGAVAMLLVLVGLFFCGNLGVWAQDGGKEWEERRKAGELLSLLHDRMRGERICLWAPQEIMGGVRQADAAVELLYGRNMWDFSLNAYAYDVYPEEIRELYEWMELEEWEEEPETDCAETAVREGVNCVLIPAYRSEETVKYLETLFGVAAERVGEYYLLAAPAAG